MKSLNYILLQKNCEDIDADIGLLDEVELVRYDRYLDPIKKAEFLAGRCFLKQELSQMVNLEPRDIRLSLSANEKPLFTANEMKYPHFNLSHSGGKVVIVFSKFPVGVDLECKRDLSMEAMQTFLSDGEQSILNDQTGAEQQQMMMQLITIKEAFIKATDKKWGLDAISFDWLQNSWQLQQPHINCAFLVQEDEKYIVSICLLKDK